MLTISCITDLFLIIYGGQDCKLWKSYLTDDGHYWLDAFMLDNYLVFHLKSYCLPLRFSECRRNRWAFCDPCENTEHSITKTLATVYIIECCYWLSWFHGWVGLMVIYYTLLSQKVQNSKLNLGFLQNAYHLCTITKLNAIYNSFWENLYIRKTSYIRRSDKDFKWSILNFIKQLKKTTRIMTWK